MSALLFETGRFIALAGGLCLGVFLIAYLRYRRAAAHLDEETPEEGMPRSMTQTVSYLRDHNYADAPDPQAQLAARYRAAVVWPFQLGVWLFCAGLALMSLTVGFVLLP